MTTENNYSKGSIGNPYTLAEATALWESGKWSGGFVEVTANTLVYFRKEQSPNGQENPNEGCDGCEEITDVDWSASNEGCDWDFGSGSSDNGSYDGSGSSSNDGSDNSGNSGSGNSGSNEGCGCDIYLNSATITDYIKDEIAIMIAVSWQYATIENGNSTSPITVRLVDYVNPSNKELITSSFVARGYWERGQIRVVIFYKIREKYTNIEYGRRIDKTISD